MDYPGWNDIRKELEFGNTETATGYFGKEAAYISLGYLPVAICRIPRKNFQGGRIADLAPDHSLINEWKTGGITQDQYVKRYWRILEKLDAGKTIMNLYDLRKQSPNGKIVLLCYEKPFSLCHRHILKFWLMEHGLAISEATTEKSLFLYAKCV